MASAYLPLTASSADILRAPGWGTPSPFTAIQITRPNASSSIASAGAVALPSALPLELVATSLYIATRHIIDGGGAVFSAELKKGSVELLVLSLLQHERRHGYEIGKLVEQRSGGNLKFQVSSLYPVLARMEEQGWIRGRWVEKQGDRRRRYYRLTREGERALALKQETWRAYTLAVGQVTGISHA